MAPGLVLVASLAAAFGVGQPPSSPATAADPTATCAPAGPATRGLSNAQVRVMLLDLEATPRLASSARALGQIVAEEAARVRGYSLLSADEVRSALDQEANKALMGCDENTCLAELAQALDAPLLIGGRLDEGQRGEPIVALTLLNTRAIVVVNRVTMPWPGDPAALPDVVRAAARTLVLEPAARPPGGVHVPALPASAQVFVDGVERTSDARSGEVGGLSIGPHEVKVLAPDKVPSTSWVVVKSGEAAPLELVLEDVPVTSTWLWLGGGAAVVVGGAAAIAVAYALGQSDVTVGAAVPLLGANDVERLPGGKR